MVTRHVPTLPELAEQRHALVIERSAKTGAVSVARPDPHGQALIYAAMTANAEHAKIASMRALDPEGSTDMTQQHEPLPDPPRCPMVSGRTGLRCSRVDKHDGPHSLDVSWETTVAVERRRRGH